MTSPPQNPNIDNNKTNNMFDQNVEDIFDTKTQPKPPPRGLEHMPVDQLMALRAEIDAYLPVRDLQDINLSRELVLQVQALQALQLRVMNDMDTPANQIAQCANSLSAALVNLVKLQTDVFTSERLKRIETILIKALQSLPMEAQTQFIAEYEAALGA